MAAAYIDFLTDANAAKVLVDTDNLPAMKDAPAPAEGVSVDVANAWQKLNEADGVIPYLDYTTPTFYDDISAAIQELLAGKQSPTEFTAGVQKAYDKWAESPLTWQSTAAPLEAAEAASRDGSPGERPPGEPRLVGYLYLLPAFVGVRRLRPVPALSRGVHLAVGLGRARRPAPGSGSTTTRRSSPTRTCAARSCTR